MDLEQALLWHDKNCHGEALQRIKSRQAVACMKREIDRLRAELETTKRHMAEDTRDIGALEDEVTALRAELAKTREARKEAESAERLWRVELAGQQECTLREMKRAEAAEAKIHKGGCAFSGPGRGDCEHFVGLPGESIPNQHDGPDDTVDCYGKPNGWCWSCWKSELIRRAEARCKELELALSGRKDGFIAGMEEAISGFVDFVDWPEYHPEGMGCGLEDRCITDRYEAMQYGFEESSERCADWVNNTVAFIRARIEEVRNVKP